MTHQNHVFNALEKASGFLTLLPEEHPLIPSRFRQKYLEARVIYGNLASATQLTTHTTAGLTVLLGNSATPSNNHLDFLKPCLPAHHPLTTSSYR